MPEPTSGFARLEAIAIEVAVEASHVIAAAIGHAVDLGRKSSPSDVVTQTDIDTERLIRQLLAQRSPGSGVIGEEGDDTPPNDGDDLTWIVDPLDGTVNFTYGIPTVAVSIAASTGGRVVAGAVVDVVSGEVFSASLGNGARRADLVLVGSACRRLEDAIVATGFSYAAELRQIQGAVVAALLPAIRDLRCFGSAALQLCWAALGRIDAYFERDTKLWDYSAGALIAAEAGLRLELPCPENGGLSVAAPPAIFDDLRDRVEMPLRPNLGAQQVESMGAR